VSVRGTSLYERLIWPFRRQDEYRYFEKICQIPHEKGSVGLVSRKMNEFIREQQNQPEAHSANVPPLKLFVNTVLSDVNEENSYPNVKLEGGGRKEPFVFPLPNATSAFSEDDPKQWHMNSLTVTGGQRVTLREGRIRSLSLTESVPYLDAESTWIGDLSVQHDSRATISLKNCWVGTVQLQSHCIRNLSIEGGYIGLVECPPPKTKNPFTGTVIISPKVCLPTSQKRSALFQGSQQYRNLRSHLEELENSPAADLMRTLELASERAEEQGFSLVKAYSWFYEKASGYGLKPGRALWLAVGLYLVSAFLVFLFDAATTLPPSSAELYVGWRADWRLDNFFSRAYRSFALSLQSIVNPFNVFGPRNLIIAATGLTKVLITTQGIVCDVLIGMAIFGIRKRMKSN